MCTVQNKTRMWADAQRDGTLPNIGGALCSAPQSLADTATGVPCSNAANIEERKTWTQSELCSWQNSLRGKSPRKCVNSVPAQKMAKHRAKFGWLPMSRRSCSNEGKTRIPLKFAGVPQQPNRSQPLVGRRSPYCEDMWRRYCCLTIFFDCRCMP